MKFENKAFQAGEYVWMQYGHDNHFEKVKIKYFEPFKNYAIIATIYIVGGIEHEDRFPEVIQNPERNLFKDTEENRKKIEEYNKRISELSHEIEDFYDDNQKENEMKCEWEGRE